MRMHFNKFKIASDSAITLVKNESVVWQYFGFNKSSSGVINQKKLFVDCAIISYRTVEMQQI